MSPETPAVVAQRPRSLWVNSAYVLLMSGKTTQIIGAGLASFAVPLIAFALTGSILAAGVVATVGELGSLVATLPSGVIADRVDRRKLLIICSAVGLVLWASLAVSAVMSTLTVWQLGFVVFGSAIVGSFYAPAESGGIQQVVPSEQLGSAVAAMEGRSAVAALIAGPVGGVLYGIGRSWPIIASAVGYAVAGICTLFVRRPLNGDLAHTKTTTALDSLREGFRFVRHVSFLKTGIVLFGMLNFGFGGLLYALNLHLVATHEQPILIGVINAVAGAVMVIGALIAGPLVKRFRGGPLSIMGLTVALVGAIGLAVSTTYVEYLVWIAVATVLIPAVNSALLGYTVAVTPSALQGRVNSVLSLSSVAVSPISPIVASALLVPLGVNATMAAFAVVLLLGVILIAANRSIRRIGKPDTWAADVVEWPRAV